jgi:deoxyribodipyrimidine photo-lyase
MASSKKTGESHFLANDMVLYIFHRDLRLADNLTLEAAIDKARELDCKLTAAFIFTEVQVTSKNKYKSSNSIQFMIESLADLARTSKGHINFWIGKDQVSVLKRELGAAQLAKAHIFETADYTPFAQARQDATKALVPEGQYHLVHDTYLTEPGTILTGSGRMFQKFTPFWEAARHKPVAEPKPQPRAIPWAKRRTDSLYLSQIAPRIGSEPNPDIHVHGGRTRGLELLQRIPRNYATIHDIPAERTTDLSAHHHFGTVSIRETFRAADGLPELRRQLYWRDFYGHICAAFEDLYGMSPYAFQAGGSEPGWRYDRATFNRWAKGKTGVPIVDAAMRQLLQTGYMHNRARLIVANYLVKDQKIYWRWGERFFAQHLVDYDFAQNFGNWAWVASVFPWSQAPFRSLKAERQAERFDPDGEYIRRWLDDEAE